MAGVPWVTENPRVERRKKQQRGIAAWRDTEAEREERGQQDIRRFLTRLQREGRGTNYDGKNDDEMNAMNTILELTQMKSRGELVLEESYPNNARRRSQDTENRT